MPRKKKTVEPEPETPVPQEEPQETVQVVEGEPDVHLDLIERGNRPCLVTLREAIMSPSGQLVYYLWGRIRMVTPEDFDPPMPNGTPSFVVVGTGSTQVMIPLERVAALASAETYPTGTGLAVYVANVPEEE